MKSKFNVLMILFMLVSITLSPATQGKVSAFAPTTFTILHTNDFHGNLEPAGSNPGAAKIATFIKGVRTAAGAENVALFDAGDIMQGSLLSNLYKGEATVAYYRSIGYNASTFGNHEFDWGQDILAERIAQAGADAAGGQTPYSYLAANVVQGSCTDANNWTPSDLAQPYKIVTLGTAPNQVRLGVIGVTTVETPIITKVESTAGLCFRDPFDAISHYYSEVDAASDVIIVLSHLGFTDSGGGYGLNVYGDQTLASKLITAGKPVMAIIGGHSHSNLSGPTWIPNSTADVKTLVVTSYYNGRQVNRINFTFDADTGQVSGLGWTQNTIASLGLADDPDTAALINSFKTPEYLELVNTPEGWINNAITRNYYGDSLMGAFVNDMILSSLNNDADPNNNAEIVFNNAGGLRADLTCAGDVYPCQLTYGQVFSVLPFGNQTLVGEMTGAQILEILNQSASLAKGSIQAAGIRFKFYRYNNDPTPGANGPDDLDGPNTWAWGAYDVCVIEGSECLPLDLERVYKVATNDFLAPGGQDLYTGFKYIQNYEVYGDMLDLVNAAFKAAHPDAASAYTAALDGRVTREGDNVSGPITPVTILHHNDSHGNVDQGAYVGYTQLATIIRQQRAFNPDRTLLLSSGDNLQGDAMMYYFRTAYSGVTSDGTVIANPSKHMNPLIQAFNAMGYDAMTLGNHEFNFGKDIFVGNLEQANFPILQANIEDDAGTYGLDMVQGGAGVQDAVTKLVGPEGIRVSILGIGNHRIPNYELPSNIPGLTFLNPIDTAASLVPGLAASSDAVIALTHIGFTSNPKSVEVDSNVDTVLAAQVPGIDAIVGGHSHTDPTRLNSNGASGNYQFLPATVAGPDNSPVLIGQAYRYNSYLGVMVLGMRLVDGKWEVAARAGKNVKVETSTPEDPEINMIVTPYTEMLATYNQMEIGDTTAQIDATTAFTEETNGANLQADAAVWELKDNGISVDFHLSGAMSNRKAPDDTVTEYPYTLKISDMFTLMPYENSLVVLSMNGPQLKAVLERAYRNYYYYKYVSGYGGYSYYTTCMIDINSGGNIVYKDQFPMLPDGENVVSLTFKDPVYGFEKEVDFTDAATYYKVSTVNYLAAGSCNFNDDGVSLWPLGSILNDTQFYVRDAVINYVKKQEVVSPAVEGRLSFIQFSHLNWLATIFGQ